MESIPIGDFSINPYGDGPVSQSGNFLGSQGTKDVGSLRIEALWRDSRTGRALHPTNWRQFSFERIFCDMDTGVMNNLKRRGRSAIPDREYSGGTFRWGNYFGPCRFVSRDGIMGMSYVVDRATVQIDERPQLSPRRFFLLIANPNQQASENHQKEGQACNDNVGDFALTYKFLAPFAWGAWAFTCAIISRFIYVRTESRPIEIFAILVALLGAAGAFGGLCLWALY